MVIKERERKKNKVRIDDSLVGEDVVIEELGRKIK